MCPRQRVASAVTDSGEAMVTEQILGGGRYRLSSPPVARGGMGEVWFGHDVKLDRPVAVKFPRLPGGAHDRELTERFVRESRITARLEHPGVPAVFDVGTVDDGRPYVVMQRVAGTTVEQLVAHGGPVAVGLAASIVAQACAVLAAAHRAGLVHRDLKPSNVMLCPDGTVKVMDFGLAVALDDPAWVEDGAGTPAYLPPERVAGGGSGARGDLYAVGCVLYELLTGRQAFRADTEHETLARQVEHLPPSPRQLRGCVPAAVDRLCLQLLAKDPRDRPTDAEGVTRALLPFATGDPARGDPLDPMRLYAAAVARVAVLPEDRRNADLVATVTTARTEAAELLRRRSGDRAAGLLQATLDDLTRAVEEDHPDLVDLRVDLAEALFADGAYSRAAGLFRVLTADLARLRPVDTTAGFRCRQQEASCLALSGEPIAALDRLTGLLADETSVLAADDPRPYMLRRQIALLELGMGRWQDAERRLRALLDDIGRVPGLDESIGTDVRSDLENLRAGVEEAR
ncbi:MAG: protein kinase [Streptosporangiales bacterium]|nr:protein kinase [Streptosporangiales bacterium]